MERRERAGAAAHPLFAWAELREDDQERDPPASVSPLPRDACDRRVRVAPASSGSPGAACRGIMAGMEAIIRNVRDIETSERQVLEHVLGQRLRENQQVIIPAVTLFRESPEGDEVTDAAPS